MKYRADVDGLRGVSILLVLFFHLGATLFSGGFIGVDVFFVISGFVITKNISERIYGGEFDLINFYYKRVKRLLPALFVTLIVSTIAAFFLFSPIDFARYGGALASSAFSVSNFYFWKEVGYFDSSVDLKPLLHTWSLAVEEQFYLFWPLLIIYLTNLTPKFKFLLFIALALFSIFISIILSDASPQAGFYLLPSRVFEFSAGAFAALWFKKTYTGVLNNLLSVIGFSLILASGMLYSTEMSYPSYFALAPTLGAFLIIITHGGFLSWVLTNHVILFMGKISYSLYLVHWPVIVYYKYWKFDALNTADYFIISGLIAVLTILLWHFIENKFRYTWPKNLNNKVFTTTFIIMSCLLAIGVFLLKEGGIPSRFPGEFYMTAEQIVEERNRYWSKFNEDGRAILKTGNRKNNVMLIGNSHVIDLVYALRENGAKDNFTFIPTTHNCYNFILSSKVEHSGICKGIERRISQYKDWAGIKAVYLHDNWPVNKTNGVERVIKIIRDGGFAGPIYIFGPKMTFTKKIPDLARSNFRLYGFNKFAMKFADKELKVSITNSIRLMLNEKKYKNVFFVDVLGEQCGDEYLNCEVLSDDNEFLYFDGGHFTLAGSRLFGSKLKIKYPHFFN